MGLLRFFLFLSIIFVNNGFLLDGNVPTNGTQHQFLTIDDKLRIERKLEEQHRDMVDIKAEQTRSLEILTAQLKQKLDELDRKIESVSNKTCDKVMMDNMDLQNQVLILENRSNILEIKVLTAQNRTDLQVERFFKENNELKTLNTQLDTIVRNLQFDLGIYKNQTAKLETEVRDLKLLKNVHDLQTLKTINTKVQTLDVKVNTLARTEQARNDDFLALYNSTTHSLKAIDIRDQKLNESFHTTVVSINNTLHHHLIALENSISSNITMLHQEMQSKENVTGTTNNKQIVAVHSFSSAKKYNDSEIVIFSNFKTSIGLSNDADFKTLGKFNCTYPGLYLFSPTMTSETINAIFNIYKDGGMFNRMYLGPTSNDRDVTGVFLFELQTGDTVYIQCYGQIDVYGESMITIVKLD